MTSHAARAAAVWTPVTLPLLHPAGGGFQGSGRGARPGWARRFALRTTSDGARWRPGRMPSTTSGRGALPVRSVWSNFGPN